MQVHSSYLVEKMANRIRCTGIAPLRTELMTKKAKFELETKKELKLKTQTLMQSIKHQPLKWVYEYHLKYH